jgi:adenylosuccinate synthase
VNGVTDLCITKADVLNDFELISLVDAYQTGGEWTTEVPYSMETISEVRTVNLKGWMSPLESATRMEELPAELRLMLGNIEDSVKLPVSMLSTGPGREELLVRN